MPQKPRYTHWTKKKTKKNMAKLRRACSEGFSLFLSAAVLPESHFIRKFIDDAAHMEYETYKRKYALGVWSDPVLGKPLPPPNGHLIASFDPGLQVVIPEMILPKLEDFLPEIKPL